MLSTCDVTIRRIGDTVVLQLTGELNSSASAVLAPAYADATSDDDPRTVVLDFTKVDYINSTGIALVVGVLARARTESRTLIAVGLSDHYREIFTITRLSDYMQMFNDLDEATGSTADA